MRMTGIKLYLLTLIAFAACARPVVITSPSRPASTPAAAPTRSINEELVSIAELINKHRRAIGCPALAWNSDVAKVAQAHSDDMVRRNYFSHNTPEGATSGQRLDKAGIRWMRVAENIAAGQGTAREVYNSWMNSPGHRANIENCALREHGIGFTRGTASLPYGTITNAWTHDFVTVRQ